MDSKGGVKMERRVREKRHGNQFSAFLITYQPYGIAGMLFYCSPLMNECVCACVQK